jgi:hypothetical protein
MEGVTAVSPSRRDACTPDALLRSERDAPGLLAATAAGFAALLRLLALLLADAGSGALQQQDTVRAGISKGSSV